ncbi:16S rRNA (cytosine967-C5)-methyltransferase [Hasllibacter halocynthiae]|uniref:16S rRNA (Cytosine967-C5)-methyltransferase n=1 Tax=Hasllibacter halocynthiae TaxID=595589 RepID=A0A2T0X3P0_9RHOB|nr:transcription antitermination factor NusB [Hasllibacter halocynthiae]PRY93558.1 16S rRNA (cytosine967-C5)-methyltransferase [Hasllibacter halocynthiae]
MEGIEARAAAVALFREVTERGCTLEEATMPDLPPAGRAAARRLATGALRHLARADAVLKPLLRKAPPPSARAVLRVAVAEIMSGGAPHAVVSDAVALARREPGAARLGGMANAVLRRAAGEEEARARWDAAGPNRLPNWIRGRVQSAVGARRTARIEAAHDRGAPLDLTPRDGEAGALATRLGGDALPSGSVRLAAPGQVSALPGFEAGEWWVQDAAAALPARMLGIERGMTALDLCAAPGGKAMQMAALGARVTALDLSEGRMARVAENLARTGLPAELVVADALAWGGPRFDRVLLDAPCSATGTIRRHPDLPFVRDGSGLKFLTAQQDALLDAALGHLAPGGRLVFCTCSLLPDEGEERIAAALARHPDIRAVDILPEGADPGWRSGGGLRTMPDLWPDWGGMDGFFMAALERA